jgi:hypothetical protein
MADLHFKATIEVEATLTTDSDGGSPRIVINKQILDIDADKLEPPKNWCGTEDGYHFTLNGQAASVTCGAVRKMKENKDER